MSPHEEPQEDATAIAAEQPEQSKAEEPAPVTDEAKAEDSQQEEAAAKAAGQIEEPMAKETAPANEEAKAGASNQEEITATAPEQPKGCSAPFETADDCAVLAGSWEQLDSVGVQAEPFNTGQTLESADKYLDGPRSKARGHSRLRKDLVNLNKAVTKWLQQEDRGELSFDEILLKIKSSTVAHHLRACHGSDFQEDRFLQDVLHKSEQAAVRGGNVRRSVRLSRAQGA